VVNAGEECDYGLLNSNTAPDGCRNDCRRAFCGDGAIDSGEVCDDRNRVNNDACKNDCTVGLGTPCYPDGANAACVSGYCGNGRCSPTGMSYIEAGTFLMGSPTTEPGRGSSETQHNVTLTRSFFMDRTEVTQGVFRAVLGSNPSAFQAGVSGVCDVTDPNSCPVERVRISSALAFANARSDADGLEQCYIVSGSSLTYYHGLDCSGYRLPTEAEWEYAYRAGSTTAFHNGPITAVSGVDSNLSVIGWYASNSGGRTHPVALKEPNAWGLYDMAGNVAEWVAGFGPRSTTTDPFIGESILARGGAARIAAQFARAANVMSQYSQSSDPAFSSYEVEDIGVGVTINRWSTEVGFRLVRTVPSQIYTPPTF
jgi:cysteine-rich repeat protein